MPCEEFSDVEPEELCPPLSRLNIVALLLQDRREYDAMQRINVGDGDVTCIFSGSEKLKIRRKYRFYI